jgi:hypothetical protein
MKRHFGVLAAMLVASTLASTASATILFSDDFETNTSANYVVNAATGNHAATFAYDYSTVGIPPAPGSGGTTSGLKLEANYVGGSGNGLSVSPLGLALSGDFKISMSVWLNAPGPFPAGGSGSTQLTTYGWGTAGTAAQHISARDSIVFGTTGEAGASQDYRVYPNGALAANQSSIYAASAFTDPLDTDDADSRNHPHNYYTALGGDAPPAAQALLFPQQTGETVVGATAFAWHDVAIRKVGAIVTWSLDGLLIGTVDITTTPALGGSNFFLGQSDINSGSSGEAQVRNLLFGLFDNVVVYTVPEPGSFSLAMVCMSVLAFKRSSC